MRAALSLALALLCINPAAAQERQWGLQMTDDDAYLMFGVPDTDDVGLSLWCRIGSGRMSLFLPVRGKARAGQRLPLRLSAGGKTYRLRAKVTRDENSGKLDAEADLGRLSVIPKALAGATSVRLRLNGAEAAFPLAEADVAGLLAVCAKP